MAEARPSLLWGAVLVLAGLLLAGASALSAFDMVQEKRAGIARVAGAMTPGFAMSHSASALIATHAQIGDGGAILLSPDIAGQARAQSLAALAREPLDFAGLRNLAILSQAAGEGDQARAYLLMAERVSRRDRQTNVLLAQIFGTQSDLPATAARLDQALRTSSSARREIMPLLYEALAQPGADRVLAAMLADDVNWEGDFWAGAARVSSALPQLAQLRIVRGQRGFTGLERDDRRLLDALVKARQFASADALFGALHGTGDVSQNALRNGQFGTAPKPGAFDWELRFDSKLTTRIVPETGELRIQTFSDGGGLVARQLVALPGARYRLTVAASEWDASDAEVVQLHLTCAETSIDSRSFALVDKVTQTRFAKPAPSCMYYWLDVVVASQADRRDNSVSIDAIVLVPLAGA